MVHLHSLWGAGGYADLHGIAIFARRFPTVVTLRDQWMLTGHCACYHGCRRWEVGCGECPDLSIPPAISADGTRHNWRRKHRVVQRSELTITAVSRYLRTEALRSPIFSGKEVEVVYNGIDTEVFKPGDRRRARSQLRLPADELLVLIAGQSLEGFRQNIAQHWRKVLQRTAAQGISALLVGHSAAAVARSLNFPAYAIPFREDPADMAQCYQAADVTLVCSEVEAFGRVAAESQACGTPVIAFDTGGLPEVVADGVGGKLVPRGDVAALEEAIRVFYRSTDERQRLSSGAVRWARQNFANDRIAGEYLKVYSRAQARHSR